MAQAGVSTLGVKFSYGIGGNSKDGNAPTTVKYLDRINTIGGITIDNEKIDASALEDLVTRYVQGRGDTGGNIAITVNISDETVEQWADVIEAQNGLTSSQALWFQTDVPGVTESFWFLAQPPTAIPQPEFGQNTLLTVDMNLTIVDYVGMAAKVTATA